MDISAVRNKLFPKRNKEEANATQKAIAASSVLVALGGTSKFTDVIVPARMARKYINCCSEAVATENQNHVHTHQRFLSDVDELQYEESQPGYMKFTFSQTQLMHYIADLIMWRNSSSPLYADTYSYELSRLRKQLPEAFTAFHTKYSA